MSKNSKKNQSEDGLFEQLGGGKLLEKKIQLLTFLKENKRKINEILSSLVKQSSLLESKNELKKKKNEKSFMNALQSIHESEISKIKRSSSHNPSSFDLFSHFLTDKKICEVDTTRIFVLGELNSGKSTFINSLLHMFRVDDDAEMEMVVPSSVGKCTTFVTYVKFSEDKFKKCEILFDDGTVKAIKFEDLIERGKKMRKDKKNAEMSVEVIGKENRKVVSVTVYKNSRLLKLLTLVDVPGYNDEVFMLENMKKIIKPTDAVVILKAYQNTSTGKGGKFSETHVLTEIKKMIPDDNRYLVAINKIDGLTKTSGIDRVKEKKKLTEKLKESLKEIIKVKKVYTISCYQYDRGPFKKFVKKVLGFSEGVIMKNVYEKMEEIENNSFLIFDLLKNIKKSKQIFSDALEKKDEIKELLFKIITKEMKNFGYLVEKKFKENNMYNNEFLLLLEEDVSLNYLDKNVKIKEVVKELVQKEFGKIINRNVLYPIIEKSFKKFLIEIKTIGIEKKVKIMLIESFEELKVFFVDPVDTRFLYTILIGGITYVLVNIGFTTILMFASFPLGLTYGFLAVIGGNILLGGTMKIKRIFSKKTVTKETIMNYVRNLLTGLILKDKYFKGLIIKQLKNSLEKKFENFEKKIKSFQLFSECLNSKINIEKEIEDFEMISKECKKEKGKLFTVIKDIPPSQNKQKKEIIIEINEPPKKKKKKKE